MTAQTADFVDQDTREAQVNARHGIKPNSWRMTLAFFVALAVMGWVVVLGIGWLIIKVMT